MNRNTIRFEELSPLIDLWCSSTLRIDGRPGRLHSSLSRSFAVMYVAKV